MALAVPRSGNRRIVVKSGLARGQLRLAVGGPDAGRPEWCNRLSASRPCRTSPTEPDCIFLSAADKEH